MNYIYAYMTRNDVYIHVYILAAHVCRFTVVYICAYICAYVLSVDNGFWLYVLCVVCVRVVFPLHNNVTMMMMMMICY